MTAMPGPTARGIHTLTRTTPFVSPQQWVLIGLLLVEVAIFSIVGTNFFSADAAYQVTRFSVELGLIVLALTPVIVSGGIDLSVGSLLGLCAVLFGKFWRDMGMPPALAGLAAIAIGGLGGSLNALLITRLRIPPLIVTLGSFSLFRGLAEGITGGVDNFTNFPASFLVLGRGPQIPIFIAAAILFWLLLHRSTVGRALSAIGYSPEGARHAGIPVERRLALVYVLCGLASGLAAVIYAARVGQAKADAGTGYELAAITAVVLGGTSIFGGRGSILGSLLGLFIIAILQIGLRMASGPGEAAGVLTGVLLLAAIAIQWVLSRAAAPTATAPTTGEKEFEMRNSQLAVLSVVILLAAAIIAGSNYLLVRSIAHNPNETPSTSGGAGPASGKKFTIAMMPKSKGNAYFIACQKGAEEAARELGVNLIWDGPTDPEPAKQNEIVDTWVARGVDVICVAAENGKGLSTALREARKRGIKVVTYDADADPDARDFFVNQATPQGIGYTLMDTAARVMGGKGEFAIITASLTAANMNEWRKHIDERLKKYPDIKCLDVRPCDDIQRKAQEEATVLLNKHPNLKLIMAICSPAVPGAAEAVKQSGRKDVKVIGLGLPNENKNYVHAGITEAVILWNTMNLGYLTVHAAHDLAGGSLTRGAKELSAGRLGTMQIEGDNILLGTPFVFTKDNIDQFDF
ncbi:MAG: substrate-binding domain-containing protein [Planctomycetota bacterium]|nr:substrate-binding domain-containing protein [Planctomycetota bacterium]